MKDPAFLFYTGDFLSGTQDMSCAEVGAYLRLLMYQHQHGKITNEKERLMRITGIFKEVEFDTVWSVVSQKFICDGNHLVNQRLNQVVTERATFKPKKIAAATLAGLISSSKSLKDKDKKKIKGLFKISDFLDFSDDDIKIKVREWFVCTVNQMVDQKVNNIEDENINNRNIGGMGEEEKEEFSFEKVWEMYGRKGNKKTSEKKWGNLKNHCKEAALKHILLYVEATPDKQYRKNFETYLNQEAWNDELPKTKNPISNETKQEYNIFRAPAEQ
ncbi:DUF1376 domain-containing protein [Parabacteroides sp. Marseille-P3160]|uniref:DUF1376 domain-containing protein n=1 Tax=Parabacteroides sp. Marseille-P3160 TaxID=1917887 RepID=UPI0009BACFD8|nr:DUF1376 domain-containing protein [Parabacteroides sp. Marseille-P3160]